MKYAIVWVGVAVIFVAVVYGLGSVLAWLFTQFGIVKPWYVFSVAWLIIGLLASVIRGGK
jgi:hypothetical protein